MGKKDSLNRNLSSFEACPGALWCESGFRQGVSVRHSPVADFSSSSV